ncbi:MAG: glycosyltransferase [FCB group bacterium]|nr:glycosyltransferase [FCB group bacterium]
MTPSGKPTLSVCIIARNEADVLRECLDSIQPVADQIIVLDTGSTDNTIAIAEKSGAEVHATAWKNDFSVARNESIQYAKGDWILWIDADEQLTSESIPKVKKCLVGVSCPTAYLVTIRSLKPDGHSYTLSDAHRLFSNHFGIRFSGRIHEQIAPSVSALSGIEKESQIILDHQGYSYSGKKADLKRKRNETLLKKAIKMEPKSAYNHYTMAQHYALYGEYKKAVSCFKKAIHIGGLPPKMTTSLQNTYAETLIRLGKSHEAQKWIEKSLAQFPNQIGAYFLQYTQANKVDSLEGQIKALEAMIEQTWLIKKHGKTLSTDVEIPIRDLEYYLIRTGMKLKEPERVERYAHRLRVRPHLTYREREILGKYFLLMGDWDRAGEQLKKIYYDQPENTTILDLLGLFYLKQKKFSAAIHYYTLFHRLKPEDKAVRRRLAGLYAKTGDVEKAEALLSS